MEKEWQGRKKDGRREEKRAACVKMLAVQPPSSFLAFLALPSFLSTHSTLPLLTLFSFSQCVVWCVVCVVRCVVWCVCVCVLCVLCVVCGVCVCCCAFVCCERVRVSMYVKERKSV